MDLLGIKVLNTTSAQNSKIASETNIVAQQASDIAQKIVQDAQGKSFEGKDQIKIRKKVIDPNYNGPEKRKIEKTLKLK
jgi:hypothetical protein